MRNAPAASTAAIIVVGVASSCLGGTAAVAAPDEPPTIETQLSQLAADRDRAAHTAEQAAETALIADEQVETAVNREHRASAAAAEAVARARRSATIAGQVAAQMAKLGAQDLSLTLILAGGSTDLLHGLGAAAQVGARADRALDSAGRDKNDAGAARSTAAAARDSLTAAQSDARDAAGRARDSADRAVAALDAGEERATALYAKLAAVHQTTAAEERARFDAAATAAEIRAFHDAQQAAGPAPAVTPTATAPTLPYPDRPLAPDPSGTIIIPPEPAAPAPAPAPAPSTATVAISFARAQLGERYAYGGSGPDVWDCSGLTRAAYAAAGIYIGTHSATNQYATMAAQHKLVPLSAAEPGDLLFWGVPGDYYHVAIYLGSGLIIEAANESAPVRVHSVWGASQVAPLVGRPWL